MRNILYVFSGEKAQGAEIVIERLMMYNAGSVNTHLFIAPGAFAKNLVAVSKPYRITCLNELRRLFRSQSGGMSFYFKAIGNHFKVSHKVLRYAKKEKIEFIHANNIVAASYLLPAVIYSKIFQRKTKWLWSDHDIGYQSKLDTAVSKIAARVYDRTLPVSRAVSKKYSGSPRAEVLYNGLNTETFKPNSNRRNIFRQVFNFPNGAIVLGLAGKIVPGKGQLSLVNVFNRLSPEYPNAYLILAGGFAEDHRDYCESVQQAIAGNEKIVYAGFLEDMPSFYDGCDIIISNSDHKMSESLGTTIYEAMSIEKILIASNTGGSGEIISEGVNGFLFNAEDERALQATLSNVLQNFDRLKPVGTAAREKVIGTFNISVMSEKYKNILAHLAG